MGDRKWEELPFDCLVEIFVRVGLASLVEAVGLVCRSWYKTSLSPLCYQSLLFPEVIPRTRQERCSAASLPTWMHPSPYGDSYEEFVKFVIGRSNGSANEVAFLSRDYMTQEVLDCIGDGCPSLKRLAFRYWDYDCIEILPNMICKWKDLESLQISISSLLEKVIPQIGIHCNKFISLSAIDIDISRTAAFGIATLLPIIKFLSLRMSRIEKSNLVVILKGCKELVYLDVSNCYGFEVDDEILNLAAHLATFKFEGVSLYSDDPWEYFGHSYLDLDSASNSD